MWHSWSGWFVAESNPSYVYSVGSSLVLVDIKIDEKQPDDITAWPQVVLSDRGRVQALATHVEHAIVYFSDTDTGAIYRTKRNQWDVAELTVQQPHVEGWLNSLFDQCFGQIMKSVNLYVSQSVCQSISESVIEENELNIVYVAVFYHFSPNLPLSYGPRRCDLLHIAFCRNSE